MTVASLIADLIRAGVDPDLVGRTAEALCDRDPIVIEKPRSAAAERQARYRERNKSSQTVTEHNNVTGKEPLDKEKPQTPKEINPPKENPPKGGQKKRATRIPEDFKPDIEYAVGLGYPRSKAEREASRFVDYWHTVPGQKGVKLDWPRTWQVWVSKNAEENGYAPPSTSDPPKLDGEVLVLNTDERVSDVRKRWEREKGRPCPNAAKWAFPEDWVKELTA